jgi:phospholipid/cholesterol/gamma-HCH transport system ATP-binding protein
MIEIKNICKEFNGVHVLENITYTFEQRKVNFIIGQSGSGKTVLLKSMIGLYEPDIGEIYYNEQSFIGINNLQKREIRKKIGVLFQGAALFDSMTVEENVMFPLKMFSNMSVEEMHERVRFCLNLVSIVGKEHLLPSEISGGMQKRVGIARAIVLNPEYLFCDEPNSGLDPKTSLVIDELIQSITHELNMTTIVVSHDMNSVMEIGDHILFIYKGKQHWQGDKKSILHSNNVELDNFVYASKFMKEIKETLANKYK